MPITIPATFARFIESLHGGKGVDWLERLPDILADCAMRWNLTYGVPFGNLTYHYTIPATRGDGAQFVTKACSPTGEYGLEADALAHFAGQGMAQLAARDDANEVMLLERLTPGTSLRGVADDAQATRIAARVMRALWRPALRSGAFPTVADWHKGFTRLRVRFDGGTGQLPAELVDLAETLYAHLSATSAPAVVLHGDLHHDNILAARREPWLGIDPKGLIGEPAYETGSWLRNWLPDLLRVPDPQATLAQRIAIFAAELAIAPARIRDWGVYQAVLSEVWRLEDEGSVGGDTLEVARLLAGIAV
jgi:streptomycin 6-kinase